MTPTRTLLVERLDRWMTSVTSIFHWIGIGFFLPVLMLLVTADVFMRYFLGGAIQGATEVGQLLLLVVFFASLPYCTVMHGHVYMELLYARFKSMGKRLANALSALAGICFSLAFSWQAARNIVEMFRFGDGAEMVKLPYWPFAVVLFISGVLMAIAFALQLVRVILSMPIHREGTLT